MKIRTHCLVTHRTLSGTVCYADLARRTRGKSEKARVKAHPDHSTATSGSRFTASPSSACGKHLPSNNDGTG